MTSEHVQSLVKKFTILVPFKNTNKEKKFAETSIPEFIKINPDEIIFCVDDHSLDDFINKICEKNNFDRYTILDKPKNQVWKMQLCNLIWHAIEYTKNEKMLLVNIDNLLLPGVMEGYSALDDPKIIYHTGHGLLYTKTFSDRIRSYYNNRASKKSKKGNSGVYWFRRSDFFKYVKKEDYMNLYNGMDTMITEEFEKQKQYKFVHSDIPNCQDLDYTNKDQPSRQFDYGVFMYANLINKIRQSKKSGIKRSIIKKFPLIFVLHQSFIRQHKYIISGYMWARKNKNSELVKLGTEHDYPYYACYSNRLIKNLKDWNKIGRIGTGFN